LCRLGIAETHSTEFDPTDERCAQSGAPTALLR
jgi:hypothetical protein